MLKWSLGGSMSREKFATQVNSEILAAVRMLAQSEGRQLQALVEEALADLVEKRKNARPRTQVKAAYLASQDKYSDLYKKPRKLKTNLTLLMGFASPTVK